MKRVLVVTAAFVLALPACAHRGELREPSSPLPISDELSTRWLAQDAQRAVANGAGAASVLASGEIGRAHV